jgi:hypothetical protein
MQNYKNAKKVLNQFFQLTKKTHIFCSENEDGKPKIGLYIVRKCAENIPQMAKWDTPNGEMGHNKRRFGTLGVCIMR